MIKLLEPEMIGKFITLYHNRVNFTNPIIESVIYDETRSLGRIYYWGNLNDGNFFICHRSGYAHLQYNEENILSQELHDIDSFIYKNDEIPEYLMFYHLPESIKVFWSNLDKKYFRIRKRRRYQVNELLFQEMDQAVYNIPDNFKLLGINKCSRKDLLLFDKDLFSKFYNSEKDFKKNSLGFILYNESGSPVALIYLICEVHSHGEYSVITLPEYRNNGYGHLITINCVRESIQKKIDFGWDVFVDYHSDSWIKKNNYGKMIREYDFITFLRR